MKQVEAVAAIAQRNNGHVKVKEAVRILTSAAQLRRRPPSEPPEYHQRIRRQAAQRRMSWP